MSTVDKAVETQIKNLQTRSGKSLDELFAILLKSGLTKHGELRDLLKRELGMGHGDANTAVHLYLQKQQAGEEASAPAEEDVLAGIYSGKKAGLRAIHEKLLAEIHNLGAFEIAPKKANVSLRRKKQFALIGPATQTQVEVGLNVKGLEPTDRLIALPPGGMCQYRVRISSADEVDDELLGWIRQAYENAA